MKRHPWTDEAFGQGNTVEYNIDKKTGVYQQTIIKKTSANRMVTIITHHLHFPAFKG